jgi:MT0933-like antitoxin protein
MPDFMDEAKNLASEHSDVVDKGLDQAEQEAENKTGGKFDSEIQGAEQQAEGFLGTDQQGGQQGQQN